MGNYPSTPQQRVEYDQYIALQRENANNPISAELRRITDPSPADPEFEAKYPGKGVKTSVSSVATATVMPQTVVTSSPPKVDDSPKASSPNSTPPPAPKSQTGGGNFRSTSDIYRKASVFDKPDGNYPIYQFNGIDHEVTIFLDNSGGFEGKEETRFYINPGAIIGLNIKDSFNDWVAGGSMTFMMCPEGDPNVFTVENLFSDQGRKTILKGITSLDRTTINYNFRADGYDLLRVLIMPKSSGRANAFGPNSDIVNVNKSDTRWMISHVFSIIDIQDVNDIPGLDGPLGSYIKCYKLTFHDVRWQMLRTTNLEYSTALPVGGFASDINNKIAPGQGVLYTGEALQDVFNSTFKQNKCPEFEIPGDWFDWDKGSSQIFYTSPANYTAADDTEYIYNQHVSSAKLQAGSKYNSVVANDISILHTNKAPRFGHIDALCLTPMQAFFDNACEARGAAPGALQYEHFFVNSFTEEKKSVKNLMQAPVGDANSDRDLKTTKYGEIVSYSFVDISPEVNSVRLNSKSVHTTSIKNKSFTVEADQHNIGFARSVIANTYISKLYRYKNSEQNIEDLYLPTLHANKETNNIFPVYCLNGDNNYEARTRIGLHDLLYTGVFQNACICFKVFGLTLRQSGVFIGIDKAEGCADNDYNNKLFGQWFVTKVEHVFQGGAYVNIIYAIKIHKFKQTPANKQFENCYRDNQVILKKSETNNNLNILGQTIPPQGDNQASSPTSQTTPSNAATTVARNTRRINNSSVSDSDVSFESPEDRETRLANSPEYVANTFKTYHNEDKEELNIIQSDEKFLKEELAKVNDLYSTAPAPGIIEGYNTAGSEPPAYKKDAVITNSMNSGNASN